MLLVDIIIRLEDMSYVSGFSGCPDQHGYLSQEYSYFLVHIQYGICYLLLTLALSNDYLAWPCFLQWARGICPLMHLLNATICNNMHEYAGKDIFNHILATKKGPNHHIKRVHVPVLLNTQVFDWLAKLAETMLCCLLPQIQFSSFPSSSSCPPTHSLFSFYFLSLPCAT